MQVVAADLAKRLGVSRARVSQLVSSGRLDGCYSGEGRNRVFDLEKTCDRLGKVLDRGQMLGNGAGTRRALEQMRAETGPRRGAGAVELPATDDSRYELARIQKAEEEARRLRRQNAEAEGLYVLASQVELSVARAIAQEVAEVETVLRDGARVVADRLGVDFKTVRKILTDQWRAHRADRAEALAAAATGARLTETERAEDI